MDGKIECRRKSCTGLAEPQGSGITENGDYHTWYWCLACGSVWTVTVPAMQQETLELLLP